MDHEDDAEYESKKDFDSALKVAHGDLMEEEDNEFRENSVPSEEERDIIETNSKKMILDDEDDITCEIQNNNQSQGKVSCNEIEKEEEQVTQSELLRNYTSSTMKMYLQQLREIAPNQSRISKEDALDLLDTFMRKNLEISDTLKNMENQDYPHPIHV